MPKRPSPTPAKQRQQKARRTRTRSDTGPPAADDSGSNTDEGERPLLSTESETELLQAHLHIAIFGNQQLKYEYHAVEYLASVMSLPSPAPNAADYLAYLKAVYPEAPASGVVRTWSKLKRYFEDAETDHSAIEGLVDVESLVRAFGEASDITTSDWATEAAASSSAPPPQEPVPAVHPPPRVVPGAATSLSTRSAGAPSSQPPSDSGSSGGSSGGGSGGSSNGGSSGSSSAKLTPTQVLVMKRLFDTNFREFGGRSWSLSSGVVVDDRLHSAIKELTYESALHSFVIENVDTVLRLFENERDRDEIKSALVTDRSEGLPALTPAEVAFLQQYDLPPTDLHRLIGTQGAISIGDALEEKPSEEFQSAAHDCVAHVLRTYQRNGMTFPHEPSEAWYNHQLWGFLPDALSCYSILEYKSGEVTSEASTQRRRKQRVSESRQNTGHKVDGLVVISNRSLEICYIEAAKNDGGANTTKCLHDTRKLMKLMKDGHHMVREKAVQDVRSRLITYSLRISGPAVTIFSLRQCPGRFLLAVAEDAQSFPLFWRADDTSTVLAVVASILRLRKAVMAMAASVASWTKRPIVGGDDGEKDWMAATMTSPQLLPSEIVTQDL